MSLGKPVLFLKPAQHVFQLADVVVMKDVHDGLFVRVLNAAHGLERLHSSRLQTGVQSFVPDEKVSRPHHHRRPSRWPDSRRKTASRLLCRAIRAMRSSSLAWSSVVPLSMGDPAGPVP